MKTIAALFALALTAAPGWTQCHKLAEINTTTPEGQLLQKAGLEEDAAKKHGTAGGVRRAISAA